MKTKEFITEVKKLGFRVINFSDCLSIYSGIEQIVYLSKCKAFCVNTAYAHFAILPKESREELYSLVNEYASTPLEDREEPQKFYLKFKLPTNYSGDFLNLNRTFDWFEINTKSNSDKFQTQFTQKEIDKIKEKFKVTFSDFEQIPVDEVEE